MYIRLDNGNPVETSGTDIRRANKQTSFPKGELPREVMESFGAIHVVDIADPVYNSATHRVERSYMQNNGVWSMQKTLAGRDASLVKAELKARVDESYEEKMRAGIVYQGLPVRTDDRSVVNIIGANRNANANRKNVIGGQPVIITSQMAAALETAITNYTDALGEKRYNLYTAINAAADLTALAAIDVNAGWPSNAY